MLVPGSSTGSVRSGKARKDELRRYVRERSPRPDGLRSGRGHERSAASGFERVEDEFEAPVELVAVVVAGLERVVDDHRGEVGQLVGG
jgi:hypothetical protein